MVILRQSKIITKMDFEKLDKKEMMAQVEWAIRTHDPFIT